MQSNASTAKRYAHVQTAGGSPAYPHLSTLQRLRRSVLACMLFEKEFYEDGQEIADRIEAIIQEVHGSKTRLADLIAVNALAIEARSVHNLRHVPLLICAALAKVGALKADTLAQVIQRADELNEFVAIYWRNGKTPLAKQIKLGLAKAFLKFDGYQLAKYDREKAVRLRDVLFMVHAKPENEAQAILWKQLVDGTLPSPETWENRLSRGDDKRKSFEELLVKGELGYLALLCNLRGMVDAGVDTTLIRSALLARKGAHRVLPFRYVAAARACPQLEPYIDQALCEAIADVPALPGKTVVLVDHSGSMNAKLSEKSDLTRLDAAAALASVIHGDLRVFSFSDALTEVPPRRGMAGVDAIQKCPWGGTQLFAAIRWVNEKVPYDRLIVVTDEQDTSGGFAYGAQRRQECPNPVDGRRGYMVNVASNKNGVGYGKWLHLDGFSESLIRWIAATEAEAGQ